MKYTLTTVLRTAERYDIFIGIEPHQSISRTTEGLLKIVGLVESPLLRVNYDTGNVYLAGGDPYEGLKAVSPCWFTSTPRTLPSSTRTRNAAR